MTTKTAVYVTFNKGTMQHQLLYTPVLSDGNAYFIGRMVSEEAPRRAWKFLPIEEPTTITAHSTRIADYNLALGFVSVDRPKFATITNADEEQITAHGVPKSLLRRISGAVSLPGTPLPEDFSDRRFESIIDGIPEGSTFVSWLLEQDAN